MAVLVVVVAVETEFVAFWGVGVAALLYCMLHIKTYFVLNCHLD